MARVPTTTSIDQQPAGTIPGQFAPRSEAAPFDFGQSRARALGAGADVGRAMQGLGQEIGRTGDVLARQAIIEQEIQNETAATEAATALSRSLNEEWAKFSELQGTAATAAFPAFQERVREIGQATLNASPNPRVQRMLAPRVGQTTEGLLASAAQWNTRQTRVASTQASVSASEQAIADGLLNRNNPQGLARSLANGLSEVTKLGELNGWDPATLAQREAEYRGRFYGAIISTTVETDPLAAQRIFDAVRPQMDAAAQLRIENMLSAPVRGRRAADIVASVTAPTTDPNSPAGIRERVFRAENPAGDARRNPNSSASGPGQITDETWATYSARLGLRPDQRNDRAAHEAIWAAYQSDARQAIGRDLTAGEQYAAWFLGIGAAKAFIMAPPGTDARALYASVAGEQRTTRAFSTNGALLRPGMTTGQVLEAVSARVGATSARQDSGALLQEALRRAGPDPQMQAAVLTQFNQWQSVLNATQAQERASLDRRIQETGAALQQGAQVSIPEADIRRLLPPEQADKALDSLYTQQVAGQVFSSVQLGTPAELQALRDDLRDGSGPVSQLLRLRRGTRMAEDGTVAEEDRAGDLAVRGEMRDLLDRKIQDRNRQLAADPAQFVLADPAVRAAAQIVAANPSDQAAMQAYTTATVAAQERLGVAGPDQRLLSKAQSQQIAASIMQADPGDGDRQNPDGPALRLRALANTYGASWPRVFQDLVRDGKLPDEYYVLGVIPSVIGQADYARMLAAAKQAGGMDKLRLTGDQTAQKQIDNEVASYTAPFAITATASGQSGGRPLAEMVENSVRDLATYYRLGGVPPATALQRATDRIINDKYEIEGTMRVPRTLPNGQPLGLQPVRRAQTDVMREMKPEDLAPLDGAVGVPEDENKRIVFRQAQRGFWVPNQRDDGLVLMMELENGGRLPVRRASGEMIQLFYDRLPEPVVQGAATMTRTDSLTRGVTRIPDAEWNAPPSQMPSTRPPPPPVRQVQPGERRGTSGSQPRGRWEPPQ